MSDIRKTIDHLQRLHEQATPEPWFLFWDEPNDPESDPPDMVGTYDPSDGEPVPLLTIDTVGHIWQDEWSADLAVTEAARNALPLLLAVARAAHTYLSGPGSVEAAALEDALDKLPMLLPRRADGTPASR